MILCSSSSSIPGQVTGSQILKVDSSFSLITAYPLFVRNGVQTVPKAIAVNASGESFVTGQVSNGGSTGIDIFTTGFSTTGAVLPLNASYSGTPNFMTKDDVAVGIAIDSVGQVLVGGRITGPQPSCFYSAALKYSPSSGGLAWVRKYQPSVGDSYSASVVNDAAFYADKLWLAGGTRHNSVPWYQNHSLRYESSATGDLYYPTGMLFTSNYYSSQYDSGTLSITSGPLGTYAYGQLVYNGGGSTEWMVYDANSLSATFRNLPLINSAQIRTAGSTLAVSGVGTSSQIITQRLLPSAWTANFTGGSSRTFAGTAVASDGSVWVASSTLNGANWDYTILRYLP